MADVALGLEANQHGADCGIGRRIRQTLANLLGGGPIAEREQRVDDLPLAAAQFVVSWCHVSSRSLQVTCYMRSLVLQMKHVKEGRDGWPCNRTVTMPFAHPLSG